jgi:phosphatidate cytidylyltransferase
MTAPGPDGRFADLGQRVLSALVLVALAATDLWLGGLAVILGVGVLASLMVWEYRRMVAGSRGGIDQIMMISVATAFLTVLVAGNVSLLSGILVLMAGTSIVALLDQPRAAWMMGGLFYIITAMAYLVHLRLRSGETDEAGLLTVVWIIGVVVAADIAAYFVGRLVGGPKLWPRVSPGKTWSGAVGGLVAASLAGAGFALYAGQAVVPVAVLSLAIGIAAQAGDLLESAVKRHYGVKDSGRLIPGHGGVLDRLDALSGALVFIALFELIDYALPVI